jgi:peptide chain release factor 1
MKNLEVLRQRLDVHQKRYDDLTEQMMEPSVLGNARLYGTLAKEQASLKMIVNTYQTFKRVLNHIQEAEQMLGESDPELKEMAQQELEELYPEQEKLFDQLELLLVPKDPHDDNHAIVEIRGAAGGDEGNIFAGDLYRMYVRYAEAMGWKIELMEAIEAEAGGYTLISFYVKGQEVYKNLKFESGSHRVQRVPKTETQGRIHTSTATVLVMPDIEEEEINIDPAELVIETHRASGAGGQHVNKTDSAVRITHTPTGISVNCQDGRSQHDNRATALRLIRARVNEVLQQRADAQKGEERRSKIGTGDRSEKIRTYNYPQNRVTDHRIGLTINQLDRIVEGKLHDVIDALLLEDQKRKLNSA